MTQRRIYQDEFPYFVTFRTREGLRWFEEGKYVEWLSCSIFNAGQLKEYDILAYQIMPDHVHVLVWKSDRTLERVRSEDVGIHNRNERTFSNARSYREYTISHLVQSIKGNFSRRLHRGNIWQRRFYARIITTDRYYYSVIQYIRNNPINADLPYRFCQEPYQYISRQRVI